MTSVEEHLDVQEACTLDDLAQCPSARIIKIFLKKFNNLQQSDFKKALKNIFDRHNYTVDALLLDVDHLKFDHGIEGDIDKFNEAYAFFQDSVAVSDTTSNNAQLEVNGTLSE